MLVKDHGVEGDAHAGRFIQHRYLAKKMPLLPNNRQVHLIASELFTELASSGFEVTPGELGENVTIAGLDLIELPLGTCLQNREFSDRRTYRPSNTLCADRWFSERAEASDDQEIRISQV